MMIALCVMSSLQMLVVLGILQLALPASITGAVYINGDQIACNQTNCDATVNCTTVTVDCPSQGPFSMFQQIYDHPFLLVNGVVNLLYYTGETMLYREPLGLIFLVTASLASTFLLNPINLILDQPTDAPLPASVLVPGIIGALLCVIEKREKETVSKPALADALLDEPSSFLSEPVESINQPLITVVVGKRSKWETVRFYLKSSLRVFVPFSMLAVTYALWFVIQKYVDNDYHVNAFGYNALDQGLLPFYIFPYLFVVSLWAPVKQFYEDDENMNETFWESIKNTWKESNLLTLFFYRLFINGRAFAYFILAVNYNLTVVYLELTLIRVIMSWLGAIVVCLLMPKFIGATPEERKATFKLINLALKFLGTGCVVASLIVLNVVYQRG